MSNPNDPLDPMAFLNNAIANAHAQNELLAANARIRQLEERLETLRDSGNAIYYCYLNAQTVTAEQLIEAMTNWQEARNHA
jgi:hemolysin-activating ACP:hemolysin acyltransferase